MNNEHRVDEIGRFVEAALQKHGIKPERSGEGKPFWKFQHGEVTVTIELTSYNDLYVSADINTLPPSNREKIKQFLAEQPMHPYNVGIMENTVRMTYRFKAGDIDSPQKETIGKNIAEFPVKADQLSRHLVNQYGCKTTLSDRHGNPGNSEGERKVRAAQLREHAATLMEAGKTDESLNVLEQAKSLYIQLNNKSGLASCFLLQGDIMKRSNRMEEALEFFGESEKLYLELKEFKGMARAFGRQANIFRKTRKFQEAYSLLNKEGDIYTKLKDNDGLADNLISKGVVVAQAGQPVKAMEHFKNAEALAKDNPGKLAECSKFMADLYRGLNQKAAAVEMYERARQLYLKIGNNNALVPINKVLAELQPEEPSPPPPPQPFSTPSRESPDTESIKEQQPRADVVVPTVPTAPPAPTARASPDRTAASAGKISAMARNVMDQVAAMTVSKSKDYAPYEAEELLRMAIDEAKANKNRVDQATLSEKLADVFYLSLDMGENALPHLKRAADIWHSLGDTRQFAVCTGKQAAVLMKISRNKEAVDFLKLEEELWRELNDYMQLARCYDKRAWLNSRDANWDSALGYLAKAEQALQHLGEEGYEFLADIWWEQGIVHGEKKEYRKQVQYWTQAVQMFKKAGVPQPKLKKQLNKLKKRHKIKG
jgi:tetratricopeptide (TPR) repeat protein